MDLLEDTQEMLNRLLQELFSGNARIDNLYYNLQYQGYYNLADAIHEPVAHVMGEWADEVSDFMIKLNLKPVRYAIDKDYAENYTVKEVFQDLLAYFEKLREIINKIIEQVSDEDELREIAIFMDDFLINKVLVFKKQAEEWQTTSERLNENMFDMNIGHHTHFIGGGVNAL